MSGITYGAPTLRIKNESQKLWYNHSNTPFGVPMSIDAQDLVFEVRVAGGNKKSGSLTTLAGWLIVIA